MSQCRSIVKLFLYCFATPAPSPVFCTPHFAPHIIRCNLIHLTLAFRTSYTPRIFVQYYISAISAGRSIFFFLCSIHYLVFKSICRQSTSSINMSPKRKATDAGSSTSPLKKRNAVTAGIGRAAESETNGFGFGYYGRTDDREDVRKSIPLYLYSSCHVSRPQFTHYTFSQFNVLRGPKQRICILA